MTTPSVHCEARLRGISKKHDKGGDYAQITLQVVPEDLPDALWKAPLGTIFVVVFARVGDDGEAVKQEGAKPKAKAAFHTLSRRQQAGIMCNDAAFQRWASKKSQQCGSKLGQDYSPDPTGARRFVLDECGIDSRRLLDISPSAGKLWNDLYARFLTEVGRATEARG